MNGSRGNIGDQVSPIKGLETLSEFNTTLSELISVERQKRKRQKEYYDKIVAAQESEIEALLTQVDDTSSKEGKEIDESGLATENRGLRVEVKALKDEIRSLFTQLLEGVSDSATTKTLYAHTYDRDRIKELEGAVESLEKDKGSAELRVAMLNEQVESLKTDNETSRSRFEEIIDELRAKTPAVNLALIRKRHEEELRNMKRKLVAAEDEIVRLRQGARA
jgi:hypothetical protein